MRFIIMALAATAILPLTGCGETSTKAEASGPQAAFMTALHDKCGRAYRGKMVSGDNQDLADKEIVLAIDPCEPGGPVTMALHANIGPLQVSSDKEVWDRSRSMTLTEQGDTLSLTIGDHRQDGTAGPMQGVTATASGQGSDTRQSFTVAGSQQPLVIDIASPAITVDIPTTEAAKGFNAAFESSDRVAMPPAAWGASKN